MTITYPLSLPASFSAARVVPSLVFVNSESMSPFTMEEQFYRWPGERWEFDVSLPPVGDRDTAEEFIAFAMKLKGRFGTFLLGDPAFKTPRGNWGGTPLVNGAGQTGNELVIDGASADVTNYAKIGDYVQVGTGSSSRLYKVTADADSDGSGNVTLEVAPDVRPGTADNAAITVTNPRGVFRMAENTVSWSYDVEGNFRYSFKAVEDL